MSKKLLLLRNWSTQVHTLPLIRLITPIIMPLWLCNYYNNIMCVTCKKEKKSVVDRLSFNEINLKSSFMWKCLSFITLYSPTQSHELLWKPWAIESLTVASENLVHSFSTSSVTNGKFTLKGNWAGQRKMEQNPRHNCRYYEYSFFYNFFFIIYINKQKNQRENHSNLLVICLRPQGTFFNL